MKKAKLTINELRVKSFVTTFKNPLKVHGGDFTIIIDHSDQGPCSVKDPTGDGIGDCPQSDPNGCTVYPAHI